MPIRQFLQCYGYQHDGCRRGEEHSFILKPATSVLKKSTTYSDKGIKLSRRNAGSKAGSMRLPPKAAEGKRIITSSSSDKYAVLISCRCNYSGNSGYPLDFLDLVCYIRFS